MHEELKPLENAAIDCFMVPKEWLPKAYQGKRSHRSLRSVVKQARKRGAIEKIFCGICRKRFIHLRRKCR
jgi:hypothetical protein